MDHDQGVDVTDPIGQDTECSSHFFCGQRLELDEERSRRRRLDYRRRRASGPRPSRRKADGTAQCVDLDELSSTEQCVDGTP